MLTGAGIGSVFGSLVIGYARNPSLKQQLFSYAILGFALSEAMGLFCLMMAFLILFAFWADCTLRTFSEYYIIVMSLFKNSRVIISLAFNNISRTKIIHQLLNYWRKTETIVAIDGVEVLNACRFAKYFSLQELWNISL